MRLGQIAKSSLPLAAMMCIATTTYADVQYLECDVISTVERTQDGQTEPIYTNHFKLNLTIIGQRRVIRVIESRGDTLEGQVQVTPKEYIFNFNYKNIHDVARNEARLDRKTGRYSASLVLSDEGSTTWTTVGDCHPAKAKPQI